MKLYASEAEDGLKESIQNNKISFASKITKSAAELSQEWLDEFVKKFTVPKAVATNLDQPDLYYMDSILVSIGINKNDDYFDAEEVWVARNTPEDKQINYEHNEKDIIGHITACYAVDEELRKIPNDVLVDRLPEKYHIITSGVLYKKWEDDELKKRMGDILEEIEAGELYVSMECLFNDFDYILIDSKGHGSIIDRNSSTAHLTKYLRAYGGDGVYDDKRIGRVIRNITFSGKGIVRKPANPDSIIFSETNPVLVTANENSGENKTMAKLETEMTVDVKTPDLEAAMAEVKELKQMLSDEKKSKAEAKAQAEKDAKAKADKELSDLKDSLKSKDVEIESLKAKLVEGEKSLETLAKKVEEAEKASKSAQEKLDKITADKKVADRIAALIKAGKSEDDARALEQKFASVNDEAFAAIVENLTVAKTDPEDQDDDEDDAEANAKAALLADLESTKKQQGTKGGDKQNELKDAFENLMSSFASHSRFSKK